MKSELKFLSLGGRWIFFGGGKLVITSKPHPPSNLNHQPALGNRHLSPSNSGRMAGLRTRDLPFGEPVLQVPQLLHHRSLI